MAIWYKIEKNDRKIKEFMDMFYTFHDYRINKVTYVLEKSYLDIFLEYDTKKEGVLLRFIDIEDFHINTKVDFESEWIWGSTLFITPEDNYFWSNEEGGTDSLEELKKYGSWVCAANVIWAVTDAKGTPIELPLTYLHQTCNILNRRTGKYETFEHEFNPLPLS